MLKEESLATHQSRGNAISQLIGGAEVTFFCAIVGYILIFFLKLAQNAVFGTANYGVLQFISSILGFASVISSIGVGQLLVTYLSKYRAQKQVALAHGVERFSIVVPFVISVLVAVCLFAFANSIVGFFGFTQSVGVLLGIVCVFLPIRVLLEITSSHLIADKLPVFPSMSQQIIDRLILFFGLGICISVHAGLSLYLCVIGLSYLVQYLFLRYEVNKHKHTLAKSDATFSMQRPAYSTKEWLFFCLPLFASGMVGYFFEWTDYFTVAKFFDSTALGVYDLTYSLAAYLLFLPSMFATLFIPVLMSHYLRDKAEFSRVWRQLAAYAFIIVVTFGTVLFTFGKELLVGLYGPIFATSVGMLQFLVVCFVIASFFLFSDQILFIQGQSRFFFVASIVCGLLDFGTNIIAAKYFGSVTGIALSTGIFLIILRFVCWIRAKQLFEKRSSAKLNIPFTKFSSILTIGVMSGIFARLIYIGLSYVVYAPFTYALVCSVACGMIFIGLLSLSKMFSLADLHLFFAGLQQFGVKLTHLHPNEHHPHHLALSRRHHIR